MTNIEPREGDTLVPAPPAATPRRPGSRGSKRIGTRAAMGVLGMSNESVWRLIHRGDLVPVAKDAPSKSQPLGFLWFDADEVEALRVSRARLDKARMILKRRAFGPIELDDDDLLTTGEAAVLLGVTRETITLGVSLGDIAATKTSGGHGRIRYGVLRAILEARESK